MAKTALEAGRLVNRHRVWDLSRLDGSQGVSAMNPDDDDGWWQQEQLLEELQWHEQRNGARNGNPQGERPRKENPGKSEEPCAF